MTNLTINVIGRTGCFTGQDMWAVSQAAPMRRVQVNGGVTLMDYCDGSPGYASGGFIADSKFTGSNIINGSQQQWITRDTNLDGWTNSVWNQVFCGDPGAPAQDFAATSGHNGASSYTTLATCPVTREAPYLYLDSGGHYRVFVPSVAQLQRPDLDCRRHAGHVAVDQLVLRGQHDQQGGPDQRGPAGRRQPAVHAGRLRIPKTIHVTRPDTKIIGLGFPTLVPTKGNVTMSVDDLPGVNLTGMIFDAGPVNSSVAAAAGHARLGDPGVGRPDNAGRRVLPDRRRHGRYRDDALRTTATTRSWTTSGCGAPTTARAAGRGPATRARPA